MGSSCTLRRAAEADRVLDDLRRRSPWILDWSYYITTRGRALHHLGRFEDEHRLAIRHHPVADNLFVRLIAESRPLAAMGRVNDIMRLIDEALATAEQPNLNEGSLMQRAAAELRAHGFESGARQAFARSRAFYERELLSGEQPGVVSWALSGTLLNLGEVDSARRVLDGMLARFPRGYRAPGELAIVAARTGDRGALARFDSMLAVSGGPLNTFDRSTVLFYRARAAAIAGERERAMAFLRDAVALGVPVDLDSVHIHQDLHVLRGIPAFDELTRLR